MPDVAARPIEAALRDAFPHFQDDAPVTPDAIRGIGREYLDMVMGWEPCKTEIEFCDDDGNIRKIVHEPGEFESGSFPGWVLEGGALSVAQPSPLREALELCEDVLKHVQQSYDCPDSPVINKAREQAAAALAIPSTDLGSRLTFCETCNGNTMHRRAAVVDGVQTFECQRCAVSRPNRAVEPK